jgi:hypothetical protein
MSADQLLTAPRLAAPKYHRLAEIVGDFAVPRMALLDFEKLSRLIPGAASALPTLNRIMEEIAQTKGCFLDRHLAEIRAVLDGLEIAPDSERSLSPLMSRRFGGDWETRAFAVRSAATSEDLDSRSFAGLYNTELNVTGAAAISMAILGVWRSAFNRAAVLERLSAGCLGGGNPMSVILQEMVAAEHAGVAFSVDPRTGRPDLVIEAVDGTGDSLVDGRATAQRRLIPRDSLDTVDSPFDRVAALCLSVEARFGKPVDIEWAVADGQVWLLQLRPITTLQGQVQRTESPVLNWADLYGDDAARLERLGPLPEFARYFRAKRKRIYDFGRRNTLVHATALAIHANRLGLEMRASEDLFASFTSDELVLDLSDNLRQIILPRQEARARICAMMFDPLQEHRIVLRDFVRGTLGLISERLDSGDIFCEWSTDGLLAINRGTALTAAFRVAADGRMSGDRPPLPAHLIERLISATLEAQGEIGPIRIEWVAGKQGLLAVDFSDAGLGQAQPTSSDEIVSHGYARAPLLKVEASDALTSASVAASVSLHQIPDSRDMGDWFGVLMRQVAAANAPPIVVVDRPYAALAALIPYVSGFVFESASVLCHLAILLREHGLPAVQSAAAYRAAASIRGLGEIDTHAGGLRLAKAQGTISEAAR